MVVLALLVGACTQGNNRIYEGDIAPQNRDLLATFSDPGGAPPPQSDSPSIDGLSRSGWQPVTVLVPSDGLASKPFYTKQHFYGNATERQRGDFPTALSALELDGDNDWTRFGESAASPLWAFWDATRMIGYDLWTNPEWNEHIYPRPPYWRAPTTVQRIPNTPTRDMSEAAQ